MLTDYRVNLNSSYNRGTLKDYNTVLTRVNVSANLVLLVTGEEDLTVGSKSYSCRTVLIN